MLSLSNNLALLIILYNKKTILKVAVWNNTITQ